MVVYILGGGSVSFKEDAKRDNQLAEELWSVVRIMPIRKLLLFMSKIWNPIKQVMIIIIKDFYYIISFGRIKL